jgi:hypothetical protein
VPAWSSLEEEQGYSRYGSSVAGAGDVNGDGNLDMLISAPDYDTALSDVGKVYLYCYSP